MSGENFNFNTEDHRYLAMTFPTQYTTELLDEFLTRVESYLSAHAEDDFTLFVDVTKVSKTSPETRLRFSEFFKRNNSIFDQHCKGFAILAANALQKGALTAIFWVKRTSWPTKVFSDRVKALEWLEAQISRAA